MKKIIIIPLVLLAITLFFGCHQTPASQPSANLTASPPPTFKPQADTFIDTLALYAQKTTLEEAVRVLGITVPVPAYLPGGYEIQEVYVQDRGVRLLISDGPIEKILVTHTNATGTRQRYDFQCKMEMSVKWYPEFFIPIRLPEEKVDINDSPGYFTELETYKRLLWDWFPPSDELGTFEIGLVANRKIAKGEMIKVAESVGFASEPELYTPQSDWVISHRLYDIKNGEFSYLCVYEDGSLDCIEMEGLLEPVARHVRIHKTGKISEKELGNLIELFEEGGFFELDHSYQFPSSTDEDGGTNFSDVHYSISTHFEHGGRTVRVNNCLSPDGGKTYPDMPYPLDEIYKRLKDITDNKTKEVTHESL